MLARVVSSHSVWLALVRDLQERCILAVPPGIKLTDLSTSQLRKMVKTLVTGPENWLKCTRPIADYTLHCNLDEFAGPWPKEWTQLVGGGRFLLLYKNRSIECWHVADDRMIWCFKDTCINSTVLTFNHELVDDGTSVMIAMGIQRVFVMQDFLTGTCMVVVRLDLEPEFATTRTQPPNERRI